MDRPLAVLSSQGVLIPIYGFDSPVAAFGDAPLFAAASEADDIVRFVVVGDRALGAGQPAVDEDIGVPLPDPVEIAARNEFGANYRVQFAPLLVARADDQNAFAGVMGSGVFTGDFLPALPDVGDLADVAAALKYRERFADFSLGRVRHRLAKLRIALTADGVKACDRHSGLLHLEDRPSRFDRVMLALVADEDDAHHAFIVCLVKEAVDLPGGKEARFVDNPGLFRER